MKLFNKILIANRGEIAVRIIQSARKLGIRTVAVYSTVDSESSHIKMADEAFCLGRQDLSETYLNIEKIIEIARSTSSEAIHPGYGFLAENPLFIAACEKSGIIFIGPNARAIGLMGNKIEARDFVKKLKVPMIDGFTGSSEFLLKNASAIPFPVLVKAAAGGGGKGMRIVNKMEDLESSLESTSREAKNYFGDPSVYIEKYIEQPRHIEIQVLGDNYGNVVQLFERECSIQRRYQKIIEESPSPTLTPELRQRMGESALTIAREIKYNSTGTIEFLVDSKLNFYFLEMNTRIQVEHPVTELVTGVDLVEEQILVAAGNALRLKQSELKQKGHAIECRIYAEDPANNFMPSPGKITLYEPPIGKHIRIDSGIEKACTILSFFDPMISKMIVWGEDREEALQRCIFALQKYIVQGIHSNIEYLMAVIQHPAFQQNDISTKFCDLYSDELLNRIRQSKSGPSLALFAFTLFSLHFKHKTNTSNIWTEIGYWRHRVQLDFEVLDEIHSLVCDRKIGNTYDINYQGRLYSVELDEIDQNEISFGVDGIKYKAHISFDEKCLAWISFNGSLFKMRRLDMLNMTDDLASNIQGDGINNLFSPMPGKVIKVNVKTGDEVKRGTVLLVVEAMKMENNILSEYDGRVDRIAVKEGDMVDTETQLVYLELIDNE